MAKINQDFEIFAGENKQLNFTITDESGEAADISGSAAVWVLARISGEPNILVQKTIAGGGITINQNVFSVLLDDVDTDILNGKYRHELRMQKDGAESVLAIGQVIVYPSLTKDIVL